MILDDFIMLGTTVPEPSKTTSRIMVCSAGYSPELRRLIRIYPLARRNIPHRWHVYRVPLEQNKADQRDESYRILGDRSEGAHDDINELFVECAPKVKAASIAADLNKRYLVESIEEANARRMSLAILRPEHMRLEFDLNPDSPDSPQLALFDIPGRGVPSGAKRFAYNPKLCFLDGKTSRRMSLRDWGCYEYMRKAGDDRRMDLTANLHINPGSSLLVGNMANQRTQWLVISVLNGLREEPGPGLFDVEDLEHAGVA